MGGTQDVLNDCYVSKKYNFEENYNSHNEYLNYYLSSGILAFTTLVFFNLYLIFFAYKKQKKLLFCSILFFSILMLVENILERRTGIILYSFYVSFFFFYEICLPENDRKT